MAKQTCYVDDLTPQQVNSLCQCAATAFAKAQGWHRRVYFSWKGECYLAQREPSGFAIARQDGVLLCRQGASGTKPQLVSVGR